MKNSPAWILQTDSRKGFPHPDFNSHISRPVSVRKRCTKCPKLKYLSCNPVSLEFGGDTNKRVLPGCLEKQGALVLNAPVLIGSLTTVVPF